MPGREEETCVCVWGGMCVLPGGLVDSCGGSSPRSHAHGTRTGGGASAGSPTGPQDLGARTSRPPLGGVTGEAAFQGPVFCSKFGRETVIFRDQTAMIRA